MTERLVLTLGIAVVLGVAWMVLNAYLSHRKQAVLASSAARVSGRERSQPPTLLYLYSKQCGQCPSQERSVNVVRSRLGNSLRIEKVNAVAAPEVAERYDVRTVPTTVVLDTSGKAVAINYGLASADKLEDQLRQAGAA